MVVRRVYALRFTVATNKLYKKSGTYRCNDFFADFSNNKNLEIKIDQINCSE